MKLRFIFIASVLCLSVNFLQEARGQWVQTNGPEGGVIYALAVSPEGLIFASTATGRMYRSTNNGNSWQQLNDVAMGAFHETINAISANANGNVIVGTFDFTFFRSTDNGDSWARVDSGLIPQRKAASVVYSFASGTDQSIYTATANGLFRSIDHGISWKLLDKGLPTASITSVAVDSAGNIFASDGRIYRSTNNGNSWSLVTGLLVYAVSSLAVDPSGTIYAGVNDVSGFGGMLCSTNNGSGWESLPWPVKEEQVNNLTTDIHGTIFAAAYQAGTYPFYGRIFRSSDKGITWQLTDSGLFPGYFRGLIANTKGRVFAGSGGGIFRTDNGGISWGPSNSGLRNSVIFDLCMSPNGSLFAATDGGVFSTADNGDSWSNHGFVATTLSFGSGGVGFAAGNGLYRTSDSGISWQKLPGIPEVNSATSIAAAANGGVYACSSTNGTTSLYISGDGGMTWYASLVTTQHLNTVATRKDGVIFAGGGDGMFRSTDEGATWFHPQISTSDSSVLTIAINSEGTVFASTLNSHLFRSSNSGAVWVDISPNSPTVCIYSIATGPANMIIAGHASGTIASSDNGNFWQEIDSGFPESYSMAVAIGNDGFAFTGSAADGVYRRSLSNSGVSTHANTPRISAAINTPNPFSSSTHITFTSTNPAFTEISVVNLLGAEVARLYSGSLEPGEHSFTWDARGMPEGMYLCMIRANGKAEEVPMVLVK